MTRKYIQDGSDFQNEQVLKLLVTIFFFFFCFFFHWCNWVCSDKTSENFSSLFCFSFFFFLSCFIGVTGCVRMRQLKISRHYFWFFLFFSFFLWCTWVRSDKTTENFSSLFCFSFFSSFFGVTGSVLLRQLKISRHCFVFFFSFFLLAIHLLRAG